MPAAVVPDNDQLLFWVERTYFRQHPSRDPHVLFVGHERMLFAGLQFQEAVEVLALPRIVRLDDRWVFAFGQPYFLYGRPARHHHFILAEDNGVVGLAVFLRYRFRLLDRLTFRCGV